MFDLARNGNNRSNLEVGGLMLSQMQRFALISIIVLVGQGSLGKIARAQVIPDGTLSTTVTATGKNFVVNSGDRLGNNLFHSFSQFSVPTGGAAIFNNATNVQNIFSRVTGGTASNIDGLIQAKGAANLFLLNPNGILFGPNARLNIGGSLIATTASRIQFSDGVAFGATTSGTPPLLTISLPVGLQFGAPTAIQVNGQGHLLSAPSLFSPISRPSTIPSGLIVNPGKTLALVGGNINLNGGLVSAFGGRIELGAVPADSLVSLTPDVRGWQLGYPSAGGQFGDIRLDSKALVDVSGILGASAGNVQLQGRNVAVLGGSALLSQNTGNQAAGSIRVNAIDQFSISGIAANRNFVSRIQSESLGKGPGADLAIQANQVDLNTGGLIRSFAFAKAPGGNITIDAQSSLQLAGQSPSGEITSIVTGTLSDAKGGDLRIMTPRVAILQSSALTATTVGTGPGGNITINATDVKVADADRKTGLTSLISTSTLRSGTAGDVTINAARLSVLAGAKIGASTLASGNAGKVTVNASESVMVSGTVPMLVGDPQKSDISSSGTSASPAIAKLLGIPPLPTGNANAVTINTPQLNLSEGGSIKVKNVGSGDGGTLLINANRVVLDSEGFFSTSTTSGQGGNITVNASDWLVLRHNSLIKTSAGQAGNGGDIKINAGFVIGVPQENTDISADAFKGQGGNITITTQSILGLQFRLQRTAESDITASSQFGVNGNVQVNTIGVDPSSGVTALPVDIVDPSQKIATGCADNRGGSFVVTGRGGIPSDPTLYTTIERTWSDLRGNGVGPSQANMVSVPHPTIIEATAWGINAQGQPALIATEERTAPTAAATCVR